MKKKGKLVCVCKEAEKNCYLLCPRGRRLEPDEVFRYPGWPKEVPK